MRILDQISSREDLLKLNTEELSVLCGEIREFLIKSVSDSGGHLASNLGIVEATLAVHLAYDTAVDRLVFDVGHQCYVHKILTGRMHEFSSLRKLGGISGFPKPEESCHDAFIAGHASNSVSVALGLARARTLEGKKHDVVAILGDGALTGGLAYEGLNDAGESKEPMVVILNDNAMSISGNVGGMSKHLALLRLKPGYFGLKKAYRKFVTAVPGGKWLYALTHKLKSFLKRSLIGTPVFEEMGLSYLGPVDGHDVKKIAYLLSVAKEMCCPVLLHIITQKGKGYPPAENAPENYHGVGQFDPQVGVTGGAKPETFSEAFGNELCKIAGEDSRVCAVTAAMPIGTGLSRFAKEYGDRFFDVGIAEGHAVSMAAGLAAGGMVPVVALYSTFLQRGFDMLLHDVALMGNHVVFAVDRCGLVGEDGATHHGVFDVGYLRQVPGMRILCPATASELKQMLQQAVAGEGPIALRYCRGYCCTEESLIHSAASGKDKQVTLVSYGPLTQNVVAAAKLLEEQGISATIVRLKELKPLDYAALESELSPNGPVIVVEDTVSAGCIGTELGAKLQHRQVVCMNFGDSFVTHGTVEELYRRTGLDARSIVQRIMEVLNIEEQGTT